MDDDTPILNKFEPFKHVQHMPPEIKPRKSFFLWLWDLIKKHKIIIAVILGIIAILAVLFIILPVVPVGSYKFVNAGTTTKLEIGQTAKLKYSNVTVKINQFFSNVCPTGKCYGSGSFVDYDFTIDGQKYVDTSLTPKVPVYRYQIETIKTDNKTYAEIKIIKS